MMESLWDSHGKRQTAEVLWAFIRELPPKK
jgi:hypothetical protein